MGHFKKAGITPKKKVAEFTRFEVGNRKGYGETVGVDIFVEGEYIDVVGISKGKGFQGVVKRHGFAGASRTHGQKHVLRSSGSVGAASYPAKVFKGTRMGGQMGNKRITVQNLEVIKVIPEHNLLILKGSVPGSKGSIVTIEK